MAHMKQKVSVTLKLPQLQNLIKRDPSAYREEFVMQKRHFDSELDIFKLRPTKNSDRFTELVTFMSHVSGCYPEDCKELTKCLVELLEVHASILHPDVRIKLFQALVIMRNKGLIDPVVLIKLCFKLFSVTDKALRMTLGEFVFNDIKNINLKKHNDTVNRNIQAVLFNVVAEDTGVTARKTVDILGQLYRRRVWTDARTVNVIGSACLNPSIRVVVSACNFFLGIETKMQEDEEEEKTVANNKEVNYHEHSKKTRKRQRDVQKQMERNSKQKRDQEKKVAEAVPLFPAIQMLHDPENLADKLFQKLRQSGERFEVKLLLMNFVSRLIGCHKLLLLNFYSFLQRYLTSHQQDVTHILAYLIQACHDLVPPEEILPVIKAIAYHFITERCTNEVITVGLNSVREIIVRVPSVLREPGMDDFVQDLAMYGKKTHKSVMVAAHGIVNLVRDLYPVLLKKADRGKLHNPNNQPAEYGQVRPASGVEGVDLLEAYERGEIEINSDDEVVWKDSKENSDADEEDEENEDDEEVEEEEEEEGSDGWQSVSSGDEEEEEEQEEEDLPRNKKARTDRTIEARAGRVMPKKSRKLEEDEVEENNGRKSKKARTAEPESESESEEDDEEGWESVNSDDDEEEVEGSQSGEEEVEEEEEEEEGTDEEGDDSGENSAQQSSRRVEKIRSRLDASRILSDQDFALIAKLKQAQAQRLLDPKFRTKAALASIAAKKAERDEEEEDARIDFSVNPDSLSAGMRTGKTSKIERMMHVLDGRKEVRFEHEGHAGGLTNKEKLRLKNFVMVRKGKRSVANKVRKSNSDVRYDAMKRKDPYGRDKRKRRRT